jgi:hypothetical protein
LRENFVAAWYYRGEIAVQRSEFAPAIAAYQHTLAVDPRFTRAYLGLAKALIAHPVELRVGSLERQNLVVYYSAGKSD